MLWPRRAKWEREQMMEAMLDEPDRLRADEARLNCPRGKRLLAMA
jgi:hypothetical protein